MHVAINAAPISDSDRTELDKLLHIAERPAVREILSRLIHASNDEVFYSFPAKPLSTTETADLLGVSRSFVNKLIREGDLECEMVGTHKRIPHSAIARFMSEREAARKQFAEARSNYAKNQTETLNELMDLM